MPASMFFPVRKTMVKNKDSPPKQEATGHFIDRLFLRNNGRKTCHNVTFTFGELLVTAVTYRIN